MTPPDSHGLDALETRQADALAMGGPDRIARQHEKGRLTARERIASLLEPDSFDELGLLARSDLPEARDRTPADGKICGYGQIGDRTVAVSADDVTVLAGAGGRIGVGKQMALMAYAQRKGYPMIHLGDAGGARVPDIMGSDGMMSMVYRIDQPPRDRSIPLLTLIMGECYGGPTWTASVSDIVIQVKGTAMCVGGPSILEIATGEQATAEALGGPALHAHTTGLVDLFADSDEHALQLARHCLSYFPSSARDLPPVAPTSQPVDTPLPELLDIVPTDPRQPYDMHRLLEQVVDTGSLLELKPSYDGSLITALARIDGHVVGLLANNPKVTAGAMGPGACEKATSFICLCDSFHIPLVFLHDTPGFFVGRRAEERQMPLKIMNFIEALHHSSVPRVSLVVRKSYGMAHCNMSGGNMGNDLMLAWPSADISFMAPAVAVNVAHGRRLAALPDEEGQALRAQMIEDMSRANAPWPAAERNLIDRVIDPRDTRRELARALARARGSDGEAGRSQRRLANWPRMA